ncbi:MAG: hypothetical protein SGPRY_000562, partial [Prymnesium sp.]
MPLHFRVLLLRIGKTLSSSPIDDPCNVKKYSAHHTGAFSHPTFEAGSCDKLWCWRSVEARAKAAKENEAEKEAEKELARGSLLLELELVPKRGSPNSPASLSALWRSCRYLTLQQEEEQRKSKDTGLLLATLRLPIDLLREVIIIRPSVTATADSEAIPWHSRAFCAALTS